MEQELIVPGKAINRDRLLFSSRADREPGHLRCGLPIGGRMVCGDARHREDRAPDQVVISGGGHSQDVWFIRSGILRVQRHAYDGRRQILSLFFPGEIVGFEGEFRDGITVETATQSGLCRIDRRKFDSMVDQNDALRAELFGQKQDQLDRLHWLTWSLGALGPDERLSAFLALCTKIMPYQPQADGTGVLSVALPRRDIADLLGTTVESVSRGAHKLAACGIIEIRGPASFRILDLPGLIALGKIDGLFDRLTVGLSRRRRQLEGLFVPRADDSVCFCGR